MTKTMFATLFAIATAGVLCVAAAAQTESGMRCFYDGQIYDDGAVVMIDGAAMRCDGATGTWVPAEPAPTEE